MNSIYLRTNFPAEFVSAFGSKSVIVKINVQVQLSSNVKEFFVIF